MQCVVLDNLSRGAAQNPAELALGLAKLGTRIGEMHKALGARDGVDDPAFAPQQITKQDLRAWQTSIAKELDETISAARAKNDDVLAKSLTDAKPALLDRLALLDQIDPDDAGFKTRIHGDLHLGQVLAKQGDCLLD